MDYSTKDVHIQELKESIADANRTLASLNEIVEALNERYGSPKLWKKVLERYDILYPKE